MLTKILAEALIIFLTTYAVLDILHRIASLFFRHSPQKNKNAMLLILLNSEQSIESVVRAAAKDAKRIGCELGIIFRNPTSENEKIALKLSDDFPHLHIAELSDEALNQIFSDNASKDA